MGKKIYSEEELAFLRAEWRKRNPEEAARRDAKRQIAPQEQEKLAAEQAELEEETIHFELPKTEAALEEYRKKIKSLWKSINTRREQYVIERDLEKAALSDEEKQQFIHFVSINYDSPNQSISAVINLLLIEGLRYPDKELNKFTYNFLREREGVNNKISWALWVNLWDTEFVPLDAVRLMLDVRDGRFFPLARFQEVVKIIAPKILRHLEQEERRMEWARGIEDSTVRSRECGRKARRIFYFQALLCAYGIPTPYSC